MKEQYKLQQESNKKQESEFGKLNEEISTLKEEQKRLEHEISMQKEHEIQVITKCEAAKSEKAQVRCLNMKYKSKRNYL